MSDQQEHTGSRAEWSGPTSRIATIRKILAIRQATTSPAPRLPSVGQPIKPDEAA